jgi:hypothetical protein
MYCVTCGMKLDVGSPRCNKCNSTSSAAGIAAAQAVAVGGSPTKQASERIRNSLDDALRAMRHMLTDPVGGLVPAVKSLGPARALSVALVFAALFALCGLFAIRTTVLAVLGAFVNTDLGTMLKVYVVMLTAPAALAASAAVARMAVKGSSAAGEEAFYATAALLPLGGVLLIGGLLGPGNVEVTAVLVLIAGCTGILMLYAGCTRVTAMSEAKAVLAIPFMIVVASWLTKVALFAVVF